MAVSAVLQSCEKYILDACFPRRCIGCEAVGAWLCERCVGALNSDVEHFEIEGTPCLGVYPFEVSLVRELIHTLKYGGIYEVAQSMLMPQVQYIREWIGNSVLVPVPLSSARWKMRGYNQAEVIARAVSDRVDGRVLKKESRSTQVGKGVDARHGVSTAFSWTGRSPSSHDIVLVDDVCTTGSTIAACAAILREKLGVQVRALVVARVH